MSDYHSSTKAMRPVLVKLGCSLVLGVATVLALPVVSTAMQPLVGEQSVGIAHAAEKKEKPKRSTRRTPAIRAKIYEKLNEAQMAADEKKYTQAIQLLNELRDKEGRNSLNSYELANLYNMYAFIYFTQEKYELALDAYRNVVKQPDIPEAMELNTKYTIAQLYFVKEDYRNGVKTLQEWFKAKQEMQEDPGAGAYALLSQGYYQLKDLNKALKYIEVAIDDYTSRGKVPKEQWWGLQRYLYYEKNDIKRVAAILEETLKHYQKKAYWLQLSAMYNELKMESKSTAAMETAYTEGVLDNDKELINMAYLYLSQEVPYKAAKVLDKGIKKGQIPATSKNLELLGNAWRQAQELKKAIPEMEKAAAKSEKGELWSRLGNIYLDNDEFGKAEKAIENAFKKGDLKRPDTAYLVLGMARFNLQEYEGAKKAFKEAAKSEKSKDYAKQWMQFMDKELQRQEALKDG
ncbi:tetratricopeptide repeat protein [Zhongshania borealis]|jgi:tetratricopeptide (TPR) repeat protein|uniref:Tetratricopeptide repeat protein n=2 Tax=Zhongshania TaxID=1434050 RepID=A0ABP7X3I2_9GAMM